MKSDAAVVPVRIDGAGARVTRLVCGGADLVNFARRARLDLDAQASPSLSVELLCRHGFDVTLDAAVTVNITLLPGFTLDEQRSGDTVTYRAVRDPVPSPDDTRGGGI